MPLISWLIWIPAGLIGWVLRLLMPFPSERALARATRARGAMAGTCLYAGIGLFGWIGIRVVVGAFLPVMQPALASVASLIVGATLLILFLGGAVATHGIADFIRSTRSIEERSTQED